jgi:beta-lactam-binding protein with PASTA domain/tRNA A-37 threonylcarbamoyl transferase component Bud32
MQQTRLNGRYEILEKIGEGGVAIVYRAQDTLLDRVVAVKVLRPQLTGDPVFLDRFRREAQAAARLSHRNVIAVYDVGQDGDQYYIVMEMVEGQDLKAYVTAHAPLPVSQALGIAEQVCAALDHAHQQGLVHRDIKPQNILVAGAGVTGQIPQVKVADFGLARSLTAVTSSEGGMVLGTVQYISPEQARGEPATPASDIYALGVVLYEMLTGRLPFESETPVGLALKHIQDEPLPPSRVNPLLPPTVDAFVLRALAKEPARRFASAAEMGAALASYRQFGEQATGQIKPLPAAARPAAPRSTQAGAQRAAQPPPVRPSPSPRPAARQQSGFDWLLLLLFIVTFIAIAGLAPLAVAVRDTIFPPSPPQLPQVRVPGVVGLEQAVAESQLLGLGLTLDVQDGRFDDKVAPQRIIAQLVPTGTLLSPGQAVAVIVSRGREKVKVPPLLALTIQDAQTRLSSVGLGVERNDAPSAQARAGMVISQDPVAETEVERGSVVRLTVSVGDRVVVPNLIGKPEVEAQQMLLAAGLATDYANPQSADQVPEPLRAAFNALPVGSVVSSDPIAGTLVERNTVVKIAVRNK